MLRDAEPAPLSHLGRRSEGSPRRLPAAGSCPARGLPAPGATLAGNPLPAMEKTSPKPGSTERGWLEFFSSRFFRLKKRGKLSLLEGKRVGRKRSLALPAAARGRSGVLPRNGSWGASSKKARLLPPGPNSAEVGVQQTLIRWEPQSCLKTSRALWKIPGLRKAWVKTWV